MIVMIFLASCTGEYLVSPSFWFASPKCSNLSFPVFCFSDGIGTYLLRCLTTELPFAFPGNVWNSKSIANEISKENHSKAAVLQFFIVLAAKKFAANYNW